MGQQNEFVQQHLTGIAKIIGLLPDLEAKACRVHVRGELAMHHAALMGYFLGQSSLPTAECAECGKEFVSARSDAKWCSNACSQKADRKRMTVLE